MRAVELVGDPEPKTAGIDLPESVYDAIAAVLLEEATSKEAVGRNAS
jgi:hypothetical protein